MRKIFITYRRTEAEYAAGALGRELRSRFGDDQIFRDKEDIAGGASWKQQLLHEIDKDSALLVLIGRDWANVKDGQGRRRLENPTDGVRLEISDGLKDGAAIIPVLLENAQMPDETELPPELQGLADFNALKLRDGDWQHDVEIICRTLERSGFKSIASVAPEPPSKHTAPAPATKTTVGLKGIVGATLLVVTFATLGWSHPGDGDRLGLAALSFVGLVLGFLTWRENRAEHNAGQILGVVVAILASFGIFVALRGISGAAGPKDRGGTGVQSERVPPAPVVEVPPGLPASLPSARSILDRHVAAIGGRETLLRYNSRHAKGTYSVPSTGISGALDWYTAKPNKSLLKVSLTGVGDVVEGFDGTYGWNLLAVTEPMLLAGTELEERRLDSDFNSELTHESRYSSITTVEQTQFAGRPCYKVRLARKAGTEDIEFYDVSTGLKAGSTRTRQSPMGAVTRTEILEDYRKFGGVAQPTTMKQQGLLQAVITIATIEYDSVSPSLFELPPAIRAQVK